MLIMRRQTSSQQSYSPSATSRFRAATISAARSTPKKSKVLQNGRPSCPPTSNLLGSLSVSRCIEAVAQYFSNPTVGFNGCPGQTVHFLVSQTPFIHFFIWNSVWLINQAKLHVKASKTAALSIPVGLTAWPQLQQVMPSADQPPLATTNFKSWPHKLVTAASSLNFSKHRCDRLASNLRPSMATIGQKFLFHQFRRRQIINYRLCPRRLLGHSFWLFIIFLHCY